MGSNIQKLSRKQSSSIKELARRKTKTPIHPARKVGSGRGSAVKVPSFLKMTVDEILQNERAMAPVFADCTLLDLLDRLSDENILDLPFSETPDGHCLGQIGIEDFVEYLITTWKDSKRNRSQGHNDEPWSIQHIREHQLGVIFAMLHQRPSPNHWSSDHLEEVLTLFAAGLQRVVVQHRSSHLKRTPVSYKVFGHHALLRHIVAHPATIDSIASNPATELSTSLSRIPKVKARDPLICALLMVRAYPGMPIAVTSSLNEDEESLLRVRRKQSISLAQAKQMTRSLPFTVVPPPQQQEQEQRQKRPKSHPSEAKEKEAERAPTKTSQEELVIGYLSESDMVQYFRILESVYNKMHGLFEQSESEERRGNESVQSELGTELLESITVYAYLKEIRNTQQKDIGYVVTIPSNTSLLDAIRAFVREQAYYVRFTEPQQLQQRRSSLATATVESPSTIVPSNAGEDRLLTTMSILHKIYSEVTRKSATSPSSSTSTSSTSSTSLTPTSSRTRHTTTTKTTKKHKRDKQQQQTL